ncbi:MAG TPA: hypothetical protein VJ852_00685 [Gemmatimonadaceae bacterium]|nr:hypothetical protein [Gemmatimonadaceae bacterium]
MKAGRGKAEARSGARIPDGDGSTSRGKPVVLSWSGGKDSALALAQLRESEEFEPIALMTSVTRGYDRISVHGVRRALLIAQADSIGLPLVEISLERNSSNAAYESAFHNALDEIRGRWPAVKHIAFGDLFLEDVRAYRERLLAGSGFDPVFPIWGRNTTDLAREFVARGYSARLVCVDTTQLDNSFAGRQFDLSLLADLPPSTDPCGERGEFHTFVSNGPIFAEAIRCETGERVLRENRFMYCDLF